MNIQLIWKDQSVTDRANASGVPNSFLRHSAFLLHCFVVRGCRITILRRTQAIQKTGIWVLFRFWLLWQWQIFKQEFFIHKSCRDETEVPVWHNRTNVRIWHGLEYPAGLTHFNTNEVTSRRGQKHTALQGVLFQAASGMQICSADETHSSGWGEGLCTDRLDSQSIVECQHT